MKLAPVRVNPVRVHPEERRMALNDGWEFRLDPDDAGVEKRWFSRAGAGWAPIKVPGCWQGQGFGGDGKDTLWDFRLEARTFRATYKGTGWYRRTFEVPAGWEGQRLWIHFGGAHPSAEVWMNGERLGENDLPFVPFGFEITDGVRRGRPNRLAVRVHERNREFGFAFGWQGNWSGLYRGVELSATGPQFLERLWLRPDASRRALAVHARIGGFSDASGDLRLRVSVQPESGNPVPVTGEAAVDGQDTAMEIGIPEPRLWSPDAPHLYRVDAVLQKGEKLLDAQSERTGFVALRAEGKQFLINGEPYFMRGSGDFVSCPETGCPDTDRDRWRRKLRALRDYGYNYVRCQTYLYAPEYFDAADEVGLLVQSEMGMIGGWGGTSPWHVYQWPKPTPDHYPTLKRQWDLSVQRDVNHPSANLYCMSNEYGKDTDFRRIAWQCGRDTKAVKPTALVIWTDGGYNPDLPGDFVNAEAEAGKEYPKALIQHEYRWWSSFPDPRLASRYSGAVRPYGVEIAREAAARRGQAHLLEAYATASQRLQFAEAKAKMELCRRDHAELAGICHFNAMDGNPSPQGIINEFYEPKITSSATWRETNGDTVVLCSLGFEDRVLTGGQRFTCRFSVSDFSHPAFEAPRLEWRLTAGARCLASGEHAYPHTPFRTCAADEIAVDLPRVSAPTAAKVETRLRENGREVVNRWDLWIFPADIPLPTAVQVYGPPQYSWLKEWQDVPRLPNAHPLTRPHSDTSSVVLLTEQLDEPLVGFLRAGGRVILAATEGLVRPHPPLFGYVKYFFTPPANYAPYEDGQNGTLIAAHPMLGNFPHDGWADLHCFRMIENAPPLDLEGLALNDADPVIRVIHRYPVLHPLAYLLERSCGRGRLIVTALTLNPAWPEARYLLAALCAYAAGGPPAGGPPLSEHSLTRLREATTLA